VASKKEYKAEGLLQQKSIKTAKHAKTTFECLRLRFDRAQPYVEQITGQIASFVVSGVLLPEERLPSSDVAAKHIGVGKDIMVGVYKILCQHGISSSTPSGTFITAQAERQARRYLFSDRIGVLIHYGHTLDLDDDEMGGVFLATLLRLEQRTPKTGNIPLDDAP
jgi:DNA-binding transcriptional regulator YhcF (GntR family)